MNKREVKLVAVTGGIGSGKTFFCETVKSKGYEVVSCDEVAAKCYLSPCFLRKAKRFFKDEIKGFFFPEADKKSIAEKLFADAELKKKYENFFHPIIIKRALKTAKKRGVKSGKRLAFVEVPLLFEGGFNDRFFSVVVIKRDLKDRIESVRRRSNLTEEEIKKRMLSQIDYDVFDFSPYVVVENDGKADFAEEVYRVLDLIEEKIK